MTSKNHTACPAWIVTSIAYPAWIATSIHCRKQEEPAVADDGTAVLGSCIKDQPRKNCGRWNARRPNGGNRHQDHCCTSVFVVEAAAAAGVDSSTNESTRRRVRCCRKDVFGVEAAVVAAAVVGKQFRFLPFESDVDLPPSW